MIYFVGVLMFWLFLFKIMILVMLLFMFSRSGNIMYGGGFLNGNVSKGVVWV